MDVSNEMVNTDTGENVSDLDFNELFKKKNYGISGLNDIGATKLGNISKSKTNSIKLIANWSLNL